MKWQAMPTLHAYAINRCVAVGTLSVNDVVFHNLISVPLDEDFLQ